MTVQEVFDIAIYLIDSQNESTGSTNTSDTKEYALRTPGLINSILDQVYPASDTYTPAVNGMRSTLPSVTSMEDNLDLDDYVCRNVMPYGLAGLLLTEENPTMANFMWQTYLENLQSAKNGIPTEIGSVEDVYGIGAGMYGGIEYGWFSRWG